MSGGMNTKRQPDKRDMQYLTFVTGRLRHLSDEEIAVQLDLGSPEALYRRLSYYGYPVCPACGATHVGADHCEETPGEEKPKERNARAGNKNSQARPLPPASSAAVLFREALEKLARELDELEHRRETHAGGRFVETDVYQAAGLMIHRESVTSEYWEELHERYGEEAFNEAGDRFWQPSVQATEPRGGDVSPTWPLPALIATYLLSGEPLEPLLRSLHPDPRDIDPKKMYTYIEGRKKLDGRDGLKVLAQQVAALVRGDSPKRGTPPKALSPAAHNVACSTTDYRKKGLSDAEIAAKFAHRDFTEHDIRRLGDLGLSWPQS